MSQYEAELELTKIHFNIDRKHEGEEQGMLLKKEGELSED